MTDPRLDRLEGILLTLLPPDGSKIPNGQLFNTISNGRNTMQGYASQIPVEDRWAIVLYVRALQRTQHPSPGDRQAQIRTMLSESLEGVIAQTLLPAADGKGRVAALEILVGVPALRNLIREGKTTQIASVMQVGAQHGMQTLDQAIMDLFASGKISKEEAQARTNNPRLVEAPPPAGQQHLRPPGKLVVRP